MIYRFDDYALDTESLELRRAGNTIALEPQVFSVLAFLIEHRERVVSKDELIDAVWGGRAISDGALNSRINAARRAVGDSGDSQAIIRTFPRRGFRFVAAVIVVPQSDLVKGAAAIPTARPTIAVLPFDNLSGDPQQGFIGEGLAADVIAALSRVRSFFVIARNSSFQYRGSATDIRQMARELNVRYVVEGSARRSGDQLRIAVQLVDGSTGHSLWSEHYDRDYAQLFDVQDELTLAIVGQLAPELSRAEYQRVKSRAPDEADAWELYQRGTHLLQRLTVENQSEARKFFAAAIERDPDFAPAHAAIAYSYWLQVLYGNANKSDAGKAIDAARRAVELDDRDPRSHFALSWAHLAERDVAAAIREAESALQLDPSFASAYHALATFFVHAGRAEEGIPLLDNAMSLSPHDPEMGLYLARMAHANLYLRRHEEALSWAGKAMQNRTFWSIRSFTASALGHLGRISQAKAMVEQLLLMKPEASVSFVERQIPTVHEPYMKHFLAGLRKAGLRETAP